jgi:hypothetical protein
VICLAGRRRTELSHRFFASKLKEYENMAKKDITQTIKEAASKAPEK